MFLLGKDKKKNESGDAPMRLDKGFVYLGGGSTLTACDRVFGIFVVFLSGDAGGECGAVCTL